MTFLLFFDKIPNNRQCDKFDFEHKKKIKTMGEEREKKAAARTLSLLHIIKSVFVTLKPYFVDCCWLLMPMDHILNIHQSS